VWLRSYSHVHHARRYCLPTEAEHEMVPLKNAVDINKTAGGLSVRLIPLLNQDEEEEAKLFVGDPTELLGKSWTYRIKIGKLQGLGFLAKRAYVQYSVFGEVRDWMVGRSE
jgi:hypothetical protein